MKKYTVIFMVCLIFMIVGIVFLSSPSFSTMIGNWVFNDPNRGNYTQTQVDLFSIFMIIFILGTPVVLIFAAIVTRVMHKKELKRLEKEGKAEEYREKADKYGF